MATTSRMAAMPLLLLALTTSAHALNAISYKGCYASSAGLSDAGSYQYQTSGYCQPICVGKSATVMGLSNGSDCWCGDQLPPASSKVDDSKCSTPCNGFGSEKCGATNYWTVYLTGITNDVTNAAAVAGPDSGSSSSSSSTSSSSSSTSSSSTATSNTTPSVVTSISPGNTVVVTVSATAANTSASPLSSGSGTSVAGIAAGVVIGVVAIAAIIGGVFFWLRHRRRQQAQEDYKRSAQVSDFMRGGAGERKPPNTGYSQMSDSRLDPEIGRRNSVGSMADEHDYSRRILRVANPDSH